MQKLYTAEQFHTNFLVKKRVAYIINVNLCIDSNIDISLDPARNFFLVSLCTHGSMRNI